MNTVLDFLGLISDYIGFVAVVLGIVFFVYLVGVMFIDRFIK